MESQSAMDAIFGVVRQVPAGRVATYGQIADLTPGCRVTARMVGQAMRFASEGVPWHRVIGAGGNLPIGRRDAVLEREQQSLLAAEGVIFTAAGKVDLSRSQWHAFEMPVVIPRTPHDR